MTLNSEDRTSTGNIPHSGNLGLEKPVVESTDLLADIKDSLVVPSGADSLTDTSKTDFDPWRPGQHLEAKKPVKSKRNLIIGGVATAAAAGVALTVGLLLPKSNSTPPAPDEPVATAPVESTTPEQPVEPTSPESYTFTGEVMEQTTSFEAMQSMDYVELAHLPYADRAAFMILNTPDNVSVASYSLAEDASTLEMPQAITGANWQSALNFAYATDADTGAKYIAGLDYYTVKDDGVLSSTYQNETDNIFATGGGAQLTTSFQFEGSGDLQSGVDRYGTPIDWMSITVTHMNDSNGEAGLTLTYQVMRIPVKLMDGRTIYTYPQGYSVPGTASPVDGAAY